MQQEKQPTAIAYIVKHIFLGACSHRLEDQTFSRKKHRRRTNKLKLSARNQFAGTVANVETGAVNGIVTIDVKGTPITATISMNAIKELGLETGKAAVAVIKATEVMVATGGMTISARNKFAAKSLLLKRVRSMTL